MAKRAKSLGDTGLSNQTRACVSNCSNSSKMVDMEKKWSKKASILGLIWLSGMLLRVYGLGNYRFGFDQVQILEKAEQISQGDLSLIGPRTGPAAMFTGPLIYYLTALWLPFVGSPEAVYMASLMIAGVSGVVIWWLVKRYEEKLAELMLAMWAWSPFLIWLDRNAWNPNLTVVAASLVFWPLWGRWQDKDWSNLDYGLIATGIWLGYQAHFSGLALVGLVGLAWLWRFRGNWLLAGASGLGLAATLLPTILFDWRHDWLNLKGLLNFNQEQVTGYGFSYWPQLKTTLTLTWSNLGGLLAYDTNRALIWVLGIGLLVWWFKVADTSRKKWVAVWLGLVAIVFAGYRGSIPEYYLMIQLPAAMLIVGSGLKNLKIDTKALALVFGGYALVWVGWKFTGEQSGMNLKNQVKTANFIKEVAGKHGLREVVFDMEEVHSEGLRYLLRDIKTAELGVKTHIAYPESGGKKAVKFGAITIWYDPRLNENFNYLETDNLIVRSPLSVRFYRSNYLLDSSFTHNQYLVQYEGNNIGWINLVSKNEKEVFERIEASQKDQSSQLGWYEVAVGGREGLMKKEADNWLIFWPEASQSAELLMNVWKLYDGNEPMIE